MRASCHSGRLESHGAYNPKHNDREFDVWIYEYLHLVYDLIVSIKSNRVHFYRVAPEWY